MKNGLIIENGVPTYYKDDKPVHKGIVRDGRDIYYIGSDGKAVKGEKYVHSSMTHHIVKHGTYKFGDNYKMKKFYFKPAKGEKWHFENLLRVFGFKKSSSKSKSKKKLDKLATALMVTLALVMAFAAGAWIASSPKRISSDVSEKAKDSTATSERDTLLSVAVPEVDEEIWLVNNSAKKVYTEGADISLLSNHNLYRPFYFKYSIRCFDSALSSKVDAVLSLSESESMDNAHVYQADPLATQLVVDNLKVDTQYYYTFDVSLFSEEYHFNGAFRTAASHRLISLPDLGNVRDVGGRKNQNGVSIKQNMIIRGSELDGLVENRYFLREEYIEYAREEFGFKTDMDLRQEVFGYPEYASRLGEDVNHVFFSAPSYASVLSEFSWPLVKKIFSFLADGSNYPIYMHCSHGADRTGTMIYLLDGILGMSEEEMKMEFILSDLDEDALTPMRAALEQIKGDTLNEKIENYLIDYAGVTKAEIASIRRLMLEQ